MDAMMPVLRVLKEGRILKNIFLNGPPPADGLYLKDPEGEETILVGRHPDCHIVVEHPSISRFHLQFCVQASSRRISAVDLSSVHGTWVSGIKLQPRVPVDLSDGDTIRIGASSRSYELHWVPLRRVFELDNSQIKNCTIEEDQTVQLEIPMHPKSPDFTKAKEKEVVSPSSPPRSESKVKSSNLLSRRSKSFGVIRVHTGRSRTEEQEEENLCKEDSDYSDMENMTGDAFPNNSKMKRHDFVPRDDDEYDYEDGDGSFLSDKENRAPHAPGREERVTSKEEFIRRRIHSDKENMTRDACQSYPKMKSHDIGTHDDAEDDEGSIQSDKENSPRAGAKTRKEEIANRRVLRIPFQSLSPRNIPNYRKIRNMVADEENLNSDSFQSSPTMKKRDIDRQSDGDDEDEDDDGSFQSDKENCAPHVPERDKGRINKEEIINRRAPRIPFQSLSPGKIPSPRKRWNMVVDTSCFLDEESRKAIQLLEGVRGTRLIVPRMVIRELDCLSKRENHLLFRKTPKVSSVLRWIEECMVKTSWWIHVQSSTERWSVAPTPPVTPIAAAPGLAEILSPTTDDHILDCAVLFREIKGDGPLVLLTNEVSLKIKAMAEGFLCESPKEFRESLFSPWSERFLWAESSPRGVTWATVDTAGPMDNSSLQRCTASRRAAQPAEAKGLKLILLHNSQYAQPNPIV